MIREVETPCDPPIARFVKRQAALFGNRKHDRDLAHNAQQELQIQKRRGNSSKGTHCPGDEINITDIEKLKVMTQIVRQRKMCACVNHEGLDGISNTFRLCWPLIE